MHPRRARDPAPRIWRNALLGWRKDTKMTRKSYKKPQLNKLGMLRQVTWYTDF